MPIRPENKARYPDDWKAISLAVKESQGWRCAFCKVKHGERICRGAGESANTFQDADGYVFDADSGAKLGRVRMSDFEGSRWVNVVLTTAHLDHQPENCERSNLKALCQRCHLRYDADHHRKTRAITRRTTGGQLQLLES